MNAVELIESGLIDTYCLGFTSPEETVLVEKMAANFPEVQNEIDRVRNSLNDFLKKGKMQPSPSVKRAVMNNIYTVQSQVEKKWVPLMHQPINFSRYFEAVQANNLITPSADFENLFVQELPSTREVINFAVWAKQGHEEEMHDDRNEFLAVMEGSCDMYMNGIKTSYKQGDIIVIETGVPHNAVVTSAQPMFALVQRQLV